MESLHTLYMHTDIPNYPSAFFKDLVFRNDFFITVIFRLPLVTAGQEQAVLDAVSQDSEGCVMAKKM